VGKLVWQDSLNTGISVIDAQHRRIVEFINQLHDARKTEDRQHIGDVIDGLVDYTVSHFAFEEALMEDAGYEFVRGHRKVHELFIRRVAQFQTKFKAGEDVAEGLHRLLSRWLFGHIRNEDSGYVSAVLPEVQHLVAEERPGGWLANTLGRFFRRA